MGPMRHENRARTVSLIRVVVAACWLSIAVGCGRDDSGVRAAALAAPSAHRLVGVWEVSFWLDHEPTLPFVSDTTPVSGTIVFAEDNHGSVSADEMAGPTHDGVYDIDFSRFGFSTREAGSLPGAVARIEQVGVPQRAGLIRKPVKDSLFIVLSPGTPLFTVRMTGPMGDDSVAGLWTASTNRSAGGTGHFVMRRVTAR